MTYDTRNVLSASRYFLAKTKSAAEGVWRTTDDGSRIFIEPGGTVRGGGPNGPVLGSKGADEPKPKKTKVLHKTSDIVEAMADQFEKKHGWKGSQTRDGFVKNWRKNLKGSEADLETVSVVAKAAEAAFEKHDLPESYVVVRKHVEFDAGKGDAFGRYENGIIIIYPEKSKAWGTTAVAPLTTGMVSPTNAYDNGLEGIIVHESGHALHDQHPETIKRAKQALNDAPDVAKQMVGRYAATAPEELVAESFAAYKHPDFKSLPENARVFIEGILGDAIRSSVD